MVQVETTCPDLRVAASARAGALTASAVPSAVPIKYVIYSDNVTVMDVKNLLGAAVYPWVGVGDDCLLSNE